MNDDEWNAQHIGRSWSGTPLEDHCPCVKEPCGLVRVSDANPACEHHPPERAKTIRQSHPASECPARISSKASSSVTAVSRPTTFSARE